MFTYSKPSYVRFVNNEIKVAPLAETAIKLARESDLLLTLCMDVIRRISAQEMYRVNESLALESQGALTFTEGQVLSASDVDNIKKYMIPMYDIKLSNFIQELAKKLTINDSGVIQLALIARLSIINNGLLHLLDIDNELKVPDTYDTDGITPLTTRDVTYDDVLECLQLTMQNKPFMTELMNSNVLNK